MKNSLPDRSPRSRQDTRPVLAECAVAERLSADAALRVPDISSLASLIADQRRELGLSLRQLGEQSGVNFSWLSRIENGQARVLPSVDAFIGLATSLQLSVAELLIRSGVDPSVVLPPAARCRELRAGVPS